MQRHHLYYPLSEVKDASATNAPLDEQFAVIDHRLDDGVLFRYGYGRDAGGVLVDSVQRLECERCHRRNHLVYATIRTLCRECDTAEVRMLDAALEGNVPAMELLVAPRLGSVPELRALLNARDTEGNTPLILAAGRNRVDAVRYLLPMPGDPLPLRMQIDGLVARATKNKRGETAKDLAYKRGFVPAAPGVYGRL